MLELTTAQLDAMRAIRERVDGHSVAAHNLPEPPRLYLVIWGKDSSPGEPVWRGTITPNGVVRETSDTEAAA